MDSSEEESIEPVGFTLKIPKFQRPKTVAKKKRYGVVRKRPCSSQNSVLSLSPVVEDDVFDIDSDASTENTAPSSSRKTKKRPRKEILASLSANIKRMPIPIPSFQMIHKKSESSELRSKKLRQLERAFFDEEDDENDRGGEDDENSSTKSNIGEEIDINAQSKSKGIQIEECNHKNSSLPKSKPVDVLVEQPCEVDDHQMEETNHPVKEVIQASSPSEDLDANPTEVIDNSSGYCENEEGDNTINVDFDGDDDGGGCNSGDLTRDNCEELPSTDSHDTTSEQKSVTASTGAAVETISMTAIDNEQPKLPSFDLDRQVDLLFQKTDTTAMSMNMFRKELERRMNMSLSKLEKKQVKARVMALLRGDIDASTEPINTSDTAMAQDKVETNANNHETNSVTKENDELQIENQQHKNSKCTATSVQDDVEANDVLEIKNGDTEAPSTSETECEVEVTHVKCSSRITNTQDAEKEVVSSGHSIEEAIQEKTNATLSADETDKKETQISACINTAQNETKTLPPDTEKSEKQVATSICSTEDTGKEVAAAPRDTDKPHSKKAFSTRKRVVRKEKDGIEPQQKKGENVVSNDPKANQVSDVHCVEVETENSTNPEPENQTKSKSNTSKPKRQRKSKPKKSEGTEAPKAAPAKKSTQTRKRPRRSAACALCKTCPCQRVSTGAENENTATLDVKDFSRSDDAVERTLIRRLQKLEKSAEIMEEQTETVRRRLKKHRRDVAKRRERQLQSAPSNATGDSYFLPDAEIFERQQSESEGLSNRVVEKAQNRMFQNVPTYQPTLFEMMGIPRDGDKTKENGGSEAADGSGNNGEQRISRDLEEIDEDDIPTEYVPERNYEERIHRVEWKNGAGDRNEGVASGSIFDAVFPFTQDADESDAVKSTLPLWDDLFESKKKEKKQADDPMFGLDDLMCLFEDGSSKDEDDRIDPTRLSQGAQKVASDVIHSVSSDTLTASYPNWKENVYFAMMQKDPDELRQAIENVQESQRRLQAEKEEMLRAWECKNAALQVYEQALKSSFDRSNPK